MDLTAKIKTALDNEDSGSYERLLSEALEMIEDLIGDLDFLESSKAGKNE